MVNNSALPLDLIFRALADPTRRAILARLANGQASVTELAEPFDVSLPAVSKHLRVLEEAQLVERTIEGRVHRIQLRPEPLAEASQWFADYRRFWSKQLDSLATYIERATPLTRKKSSRSQGRS